jgi:hypothetical protein
MIAKEFEGRHTMPIAASTQRNSITGSLLGTTLLALSLAMTAPCAQPQSVVDAGTATLSGTVMDVTGAFVPGAIVSLGTAERLHQQTTTDNKGHFAIEATPGEYTLRAVSPGFFVFKETVHLTAATPITQNVTLSIGTFSGPVVEDPHPVKSLNAPLDLLLPLTPLPPFHLSAKSLKHLQR